MTKLYMRIVAFFTGGFLVWLQDYDGSETLSIAYKTHFGKTTAKRWWPWNIGAICVLHDSGEVTHSYVTRWVKA